LSAKSRVGFAAVLAVLGTSDIQISASAPATVLMSEGDQPLVSTPPLASEREVRYWRWYTTAAPSGVKLGQATRTVPLVEFTPEETVGVTSRVLETAQPVELPAQGAEEHLKSTTARRVPAEFEAIVPEGDLGNASPPQKPNASRVPSVENRGVTANALFGHELIAIAELGFEGLYSFE
jgi:hypothetical protein